MIRAGKETTTVTRTIPQQNGNITMADVPTTSRINTNAQLRYPVSNETENSDRTSRRSDANPFFFLRTVAYALEQSSHRNGANGSSCDLTPTTGRTTTVKEAIKTQQRMNSR
jgi:hypothetical protein